jgi:oligosaccharide repeat unit polymerase
MKFKKSYSRLFVFCMLVVVIFIGMVNTGGGDFLVSAIEMLLVLMLLWGATYHKSDLPYLSPWFVFLMIFCASVCLKMLFLAFYMEDYKELLLGKEFSHGVMLIFLFVLISVAVYFILCLTVVKQGLVKVKPKRIPASSSISEVSLFFSCVIAIAIFLYFSKYGDFSGSLTQKRFKDIEGGAANRFLSPMYWSYKVLVLSKIPFYLALYAYAIGYKAKLLYVIGFCSFLVSIFIAVYFSNRSEILMIFADLILIYYAVIKASPFTNPRIIFIVVLFLLSFVWLTLARDGGMGIAELLRAFFEQRYLLSPEKIGAIAMIGDDVYNLFYLKSYIGFLLLPSSDLSEPFRWLHYNVAENTFGIYTGSAVPPGGIAEAFINGGYIVLMALSGVFGLFIALLSSMIRVSLRLYRYDVLILTLIFSNRFVFFFLNTELGTALLKASFETLIMFLIFKLVFLLNRVKIIRSKGV